LNGDGFGGPPWSARVSLANLSTNSYEAIGQSVAAGAARAVQRFQEWKRQGRASARSETRTKAKARGKTRRKS
jgi:aspartate 4-decarboxylase